MTYMRLRPKSDFLETGDWEQLYVLSEHWQSDMAFYKDELKFLRNLIDKYFLWLVLEENISKANALTVDIKKAQLEEEWLDQAIIRHMSHIADIVKNEFPKDEKAFRDEHTLLEDKMVDFVQLYRKLKSEVFTVTEYIMETEELSERMPYKTRS